MCIRDRLQPDHPRENFRDNRCRVYKQDALPFWYITTTNNMKAMKGSQTPTQWLTGQPVVPAAVSLHLFHTYAHYWYRQAPFIPV